MRAAPVNSVVHQRLQRGSPDDVLKQYCRNGEAHAMPAFRSVAMRVVNVQDCECIDDGEIQPPGRAVGEYQRDEGPDKHDELGETGSHDDGEVVLDAGERVLFQATNQFAHRTVPFNRDEAVATYEVLVKAVFLEQLAKFHVVVWPHGDCPMAADGAVRLGPHEVERTDADVSRAFRVTRFPRFGVETEEQGKSATEHAQQEAGHLQMRGDGKVVDFFAMQIGDSAADYRMLHYHVGIRKENQIARRPFCAEMLGVILAEPVLGQIHDVDYVYARILVCQTVENGASFVRRAVIDDDEFKVWVVLREKGSQRGFDLARFVASGDNHRDLRQLAALKRRDISQMRQRAIADGKLDGRCQHHQERYYREPK